MKCPHCAVEAHFYWAYNQLRTQGIAGTDTHRRMKWAYCPSSGCGKLVTYYQVALDGGSGEPDYSDTLIEPANQTRGPISHDVPAALREDYAEACAVLATSPKASAALARRCLQALLRDAGYNQRDLALQIDAVLNESDVARMIPATLRMAVDAIRNFGNFSAHPVNDVSTLQIIEVEPEEAEWCLEVLEECFDHFYVRPARARERKAQLDEKLTRAGKPPSKGGSA